MACNQATFPVSAGGRRSWPGLGGEILFFPVWHLIVVLWPDGGLKKTGNGVMVLFAYVYYPREGPTCDSHHVSMFRETRKPGRGQNVKQGLECGRSGTEQNKYMFLPSQLHPDPLLAVAHFQTTLSDQKDRNTLLDVQLLMP